jgi:hypothetical protein
MERSGCDVASMLTRQNFIDGALVDSVDGELEPVLDPATGT